jgi:hypothetical protein
MGKWPPALAFYRLKTTGDQINRAGPRSERHASCGPGRTCQRCRWRATSRAACGHDWPNFPRTWLAHLGYTYVWLCPIRGIGALELSVMTPLNPTEEFLKHAAECELMAKFTRDPKNKATWSRMAERWHRCAKLFTSQSLAAHHHTAAKRRRNPAPSWAHY